MEEELLLGLIIYFSIWMLVSLIAIQVLWIASIFNCVTREKDRIKQIFWLLVILGLGSIGLFIYLFHRVPTRRKEERDPEFNSTIEERIMSKISIKRPPKRKYIFRPAWPETILKTIFALVITFLFVFFMISLIKMLIEMRANTGIENDITLDPLYFVGPMITLAMIFVFGLFMNPRSGWNRIIITGMNEEKLDGHLRSVGFEDAENGLYLQVESNIGVIIKTFQVDEEIGNYLKSRNVDHRPEDSVFLLASIANPKMGEPMRLIHQDSIFKVGPAYRVSERFREEMRKMDGVGSIDLTFRKVKKI